MLYNLPEVSIGQSFSVFLSVCESNQLVGGRCGRLARRERLDPHRSVHLEEGGRSLVMLVGGKREGIAERDKFLKPGTQN